MTDQPTAPAPPQAGTVQIGAGSTAGAALVATIWNNVIAPNTNVQPISAEVAVVLTPFVAAVVTYLIGWLPRPKRKEQADG